MTSTRHTAADAASDSDIPRAAELLESVLRLCERLPPDLTADRLRRRVWRAVWQARDLLRDQPIGIWPGFSGRGRVAAAEQPGTETSHAVSPQGV